jgi:hypothetical protein
MITNEAEIRIALQAALASVLALYGFWGCALVMIVILLPWKPILAAGGYLVQPVVDWHIDKALDRHEKAMAENANATNADSSMPSCSPLPSPLESLELNPAAAIEFRDVASNPQKLSGILAIPPAIKQHVGSLPQGVFSNMKLVVERVTFQGDTADAHVRFQSPNVAELVIRQRYVLRKSGDHWQVESLQPANGESTARARLPSAGRPRMHPV